MSNPKEAVIRSSFFPPDVLDGTKLFIVEVDSEIPIFAVKTRWEIFGYTRDIKGAIAAFEELLLVKDASEIDQVLTWQRARGNLKRRKASQKTLTAGHIHEGGGMRCHKELGTVLLRLLAEERQELALHPGVHMDLRFLDTHAAAS